MLNLGEGPHNHFCLASKYFYLDGRLTPKQRLIGLAEPVLRLNILSLGAIRFFSTWSPELGIAAIFVARLWELFQRTAFRCFPFVEELLSSASGVVG